jgi:hypothetical protein
MKNSFKCTHPDCIKSIREFSETGLSQHMKAKHEIQNQSINTIQNVLLPINGTINPKSKNYLKCTHPDCVNSHNSWREFTHRTGLAAHMKAKHGIGEHLPKDPKGKELPMRYKGTIIEAVARGNKEEVSKFLAEGCLTDYGDEALSTACRYGHADIVKLLLLHGAEVYWDSDGEFDYDDSPLNTAMKFRHYHCAKLLPGYSPRLGGLQPEPEGVYCAGLLIHTI